MTHGGHLLLRGWYKPSPHIRGNKGSKRNKHSLWTLPSCASLLHYRILSLWFAITSWMRQDVSLSNIVFKQMHTNKGRPNPTTQPKSHWNCTIIKKHLVIPSVRMGDLHSIWCCFRHTLPMRATQSWWGYPCILDKLNPTIWKPLGFPLWGWG